MQAVLRTWSTRGHRQSHGKFLFVLLQAVSYCRVCAPSPQNFFRVDVDSLCIQTMTPSESCLRHIFPAETALCARKANVGAAEEAGLDITKSWGCGARSRCPSIAGPKRCVEPATSPSYKRWTSQRELVLPSLVLEGHEELTVVRWNCMWLTMLLLGDGR